MGARSSGMARTGMVLVALAGIALSGVANGGEAEEAPVGKDGQVKGTFTGNEKTMAFKCGYIHPIEDPFDEDILYVGTDLGIYCSIDRGKSWHSLCNHLPTTPVHDIAVHPREGDLVIGTHGRSAFVLDAKKIREMKRGRGPSAPRS